MFLRNYVCIGGLRRGLIKSDTPVTIGARVEHDMPVNGLGTLHLRATDDRDSIQQSVSLAMSREQHDAEFLITVLCCTPWGSPSSRLTPGFQGEPDNHIHGIQSNYNLYTDLSLNLCELDPPKLSTAEVHSDSL